MYSDTTLPEQLIGLYRNKEVGSLLLYMLSYLHKPSCMHHYLIVPMLGPCVFVKGFTIGTHFQCHSEWEHPIKDMMGFPMILKLSVQLEGQKRDFSSLSKGSPLDGN